MKINVTFVFLFLFFAVEAQEASFFFVQMSDTQLGMKEQNKSFTEESNCIENVIAYINRIKPKFVVITGDLINKEGDSLQINEFKRLMSLFDKKLPLYMVPGNHDVGRLSDEKSIGQYKEIFNDDKFVATYPNTLLIGINSQLIWARNWALEKSQFQWLEEELAKNKHKRHKIVFAHHPIFVSSPSEPDKYQNFPIERRQAYINLFSRYNVEFMFTGHLHSNNETKIGQLNIITTNAVCVSHSDEPAGFRIIKIYPDKILHHYHTLQNAPASIQL